MQLKGIPASAGLSWGRAMQVPASARQPEADTIASLLVPAELDRFDAAVKQSGDALAAIRTSLLAHGRTEEADIIEVQLYLLADGELIGKARDKIEKAHFSCQAALQEAMSEALGMLHRLDPVSFKERAPDIEDVIQRILRALRGEKGVLEEIVGTESLILLCDNLSPSEAVLLDPRTIAGVAVVHGSATSHFAIIARSIGIPAVVGIGADLRSIRDGQTVLIDGSNGTLTVDPPARQLAEDRQAVSAAGGCKPQGALPLPLQTAGDDRPLLMSNISSVSEAVAAQNYGADGIGLFRTEFLFMGRENFPSEDEQFEAYRAVVSAFPAQTPIVIRTMDVGGDKPLSLLKLEEEDNPFLGNRGMRISLKRQDLLRTQLRALLRASAYGNVKLLFPMISTVDEWRQATAVVEQVQSELAQSCIPFNRHIERGVMIEVPSAAIMADRLAREADFFSIGTNDLIQYTMAANRNSPSMKELLDPLQPALLRLIHRIIRCAHDLNKKGEHMRRDGGRDRRRAASARHGPGRFQRRQRVVIVHRMAAQPAIGSLGQGLLEAGGRGRNGSGRRAVRPPIRRKSFSGALPYKLLDRFSICKSDSPARGPALVGAGPAGGAS
ncbi:phosphoenolpyruvate--protein phosphotransferase [Cohnella rhizosphaerae]|uniref:Phosphoenolpyruvate-protein phosphotransferase n=1 Tax=Cohnella rhizosphaerae TaxID=1457232 RepID=A0A9X4L1R0_9BACL|nr:phosphoenolpyruvate--protein phosphotransferase [Cohnella rhizosphaerae]MDG0814516.1 phosphoenolpyruvate--protein phosphotransferase [Cohnella rhizosphaerae]